MKGTQNQVAQLSQGEGIPRSRTGMRQPLLDHAGASLLFLGLLPPFFLVRSLLFYIILFCSSSSYTCQSSMPILECTSYRPFFLTLCELLWPPSPCPGVTSTSKEVIAFLRTASPPTPLWLAHMAWNLFYDPQGDFLERRGAFLSHVFVLSRTGSSSAVQSGSLDSLHLSPGTSSSSS